MQNSYPDNLPIFPSFQEGRVSEFGTLRDSDGVFSGDFSHFDNSPHFENEPPRLTLGVIGRPNVGKSTLVNRILGRREAVVEDRPGVTRDRVIYEANWAGYDFNLMDTGGWDNKAGGLEKLVTKAAAFGIEMADVLLFIVDVHAGITNTDEALLKLVRRSKKPAILVVNKVDSTAAELEAASFWNLGLGEPFPVSALHGRGSGELLDKAVSHLREVEYVHSPEGVARFDAPHEEPRKVALIGRPNVGKSSLLNQISGRNTAVISNIAGTTRDPVDELIEFGDKNGSRMWKFIDTAGIRRRVHLAEGADFYASLRTQAAIARAELALCVIDVSEELAEQDIRVVNIAVESGRAVVLVFNKWDTLAEKFDTEGRRQILEREIEKDLAFVSWAPRVNLSAKTGWHKDRLIKAMDTALESWDTRIPTGRLNAFLGSLVSEHPHPLRGGKQPRILYGTQVSSRPPRFVIFASGFLEHQYRRFIERRMREEFGFEGSPIEISMRVREKHKDRK